METSKENSLGNEHIPVQTIGSEMNASADKQFGTFFEAEAFYQIVKQRLLTVNQWYDFADLPMSAFKLFDHSGRSADRIAKEGDHIRIDIPGPGTKTGGGYDWVVIEKITEEATGQNQVISMRVRPAAHPLSEDKHTAHFLKETATSTFQVKQMGTKVRTEQHGRNEEPNTETAHTLDNFRNTMIGWGSKLGFSYPQWKSLVKGLIAR